MNTYNAMAKAAVVALLAPADRTATPGSPTGVDVSSFEGLATAILHSAAGTGTSPTMAAKLVECDTSGGTYTDVPAGAYATVTDVANSGIQKIVINMGDRKAFLAILPTIGGTSPHFISSASLVGMKKYS